MNQAASAAVSPAAVPRNLLRRIRQLAPMITAASAVATIVGALFGVYGELRATAATQGEKIDTIARELGHEHELAGEARTATRQFEAEVRLELRRISDKLDGKLDRAQR